MECQLCGKELADDETYACEQCADDCQHLEVVDKIRGRVMRKPAKKYIPFILCWVIFALCLGIYEYWW